MPGTPGVYTVLFDGSCRFCVESTSRLRRLTRPETVRFLDFNAPGVLAAFPGVTSQACRQGVQLITPQCQIFAGAEAIARLLATRPVLSPLAAAYFLPGLRQVIDRTYAWIARNRYRLRGRVPNLTCQNGACAVHRIESSTAPPHNTPGPSSTR